MTELEAIKMASRLRQLIRTMNDEQERTAAKLILQYDAGTVFECIEEHARQHEFFNLHKLMETVRMRCRQPEDPADAAAKARALQEYRTKVRDRWDELGDVDALHAKQDKLIEEFSDDELATLKEVAIANSRRDEETKKFMRTKNPRTSRLLKSMIYTEMQQTGEVPS